MTMRSRQPTVWLGHSLDNASKCVVDPAAVRRFGSSETCEELKYFGGCSGCDESGVSAWDRQEDVRTLKRNAAALNDEIRSRSPQRDVALTLLRSIAAKAEAIARSPRQHIR
jgi:hypothetical protein